MWTLTVQVLIFVFCYQVTCIGTGVGITFSGAGGRIGQHVGLAETLLTGNYPGGKPLRPDFLSGASTGSISCVIVNAIVESQETQRTNWTWEYAKELVFHLTTGDVIDDSIEGIIEITKNMIEGYFLDNSPLREFLRKQLNSAGYSKFGDLYIPTAISLVNQSSGMSIRFWSDDPQYANLDLLELLMASAALPMAFLPVTVPELGDTTWIDGGTGIDTLPVYSLLHRNEVKIIFVLCYGSAMTTGGATVPKILDHVTLLKNALATFDDMRVDLFLGGIDILSGQQVKPSFSYIPVLNQTFSVLDFDDGKLEYTLTVDWATQHAPTRLN